MSNTNPEKEVISLPISVEEPEKKLIAGMNGQLVENAKIMVVGAGALGNEVLKNLALIGVRRLLLVDFDIIERSNLAKSVLYRESDCTGSRFKVDIAAARLREINPQLEIVTINGDATLDVGLGLIRRMDAIIGCLDNRLTRMMLNRFAFSLGKGWVDGGIMDMEGQVDVYTPTINCYECGLSEKALANIAYKNGCLNRMRRYSSAGYANTNSIAASVVGAIQTQEALKLVASPEKTLAGSQFYFNGKANFYDRIGKQSPRRKGCRSHEILTEIIEAPEISAETKIGEVFSWLENHFNTDEIVIKLHYQVVITATTGTSGKVKSFVKARPHLEDADLIGLREIEDEEVRFETVDLIDKNFPHLNLPLKAIGVPYWHILKVTVAGQNKYIELTKDLHKYELFA